MAFLSIDELNLSVRAKRCLEKAGIDTIEKLIETSDDKLKAIKERALAGIDLRHVKAKRVTQAHEGDAVDDDLREAVECHSNFSGASSALTRYTNKPRAATPARSENRFMRLLRIACARVSHRGAAAPRLPVPRRRQQSHTGCPSSLSRCRFEGVQSQVQLQHVHPRFAPNAEVPLLGVARDQRPDVGGREGPLAVPR